MPGNALLLSAALLLAALPAGSAGRDPLQPSPELKAYAEHVARFTAREELPSELGLVAPAQMRKLLDELGGWPAANARLLARHAIVMHVYASFLHTQRGNFAASERHAEMVERLLALAAARRGPPAERAREAALRRGVRLSRSHDLLRRWQPSRALEVLERVLLEDPAEPDALLAAGMAEELRATRPALAVERYLDPSAWSEGRKAAGKGKIPKLKELERDRRRSLDTAEALLRRATLAAPVRGTARLHLGAVLLALGRREEAASEWQAVLEDRPDPEDANLAHLFLGRAAEQGQDWSAAAAHYRAVLQSVPGSQSASLGLTHALDRLQDRAAAREVLVAALAGEAGAPRAGDGDPWVQYLYAPTRRQRAVLEGMLESLK